MKKWILVFLAIYLFIGYLLLFNGKSGDIASEKENIESNTDKYWIINDPKNSNYKPPHWLLDRSLEDYVDDKTHHMEQVKPTTPDYRLMTFFAQAQLGDAHPLSSFINPLISYKDFTSFDVDEINQKTELYAKTITRDRSIAAVYISRPKLNTPDKVIFDVTLVYKDKKPTTLTDIPMVQMSEDINWYLDITLTELASRVELAQKNSETQ